jgi:leucyl aminopeptidase
VPETVYDQVQESIKLAFYKIYARELANSRVTSDFFVEEVNSLFSDNVEKRVIRGDQLKDEGLNLVHAVGKGATSQPTLINLTYRGNNNDPRVYALVGKGITFDTGGLHLKPYGSMETMYLDKTGACAVLAAFRGVVEMGLKINVTATLGLAENAINNTSYKPADIIKSHKGLTVEIKNTDAEGRLVLADCISWTQQ